MKVIYLNFIKKKINKPNYNLFTAKDSIKDNNKYLSKHLREIYTIGKKKILVNQRKIMKLF